MLSRCLSHRLDFDDELPSLDHERIAERCVLFTSLHVIAVHVADTHAQCC